MPRFTKSFLKRRKDYLSAMLEELLSEQKKLRQNFNLDPEAIKEQLDLASATLDQDLSILRTNGCLNKFILITEAIQAINKGNYGICLECGENIPEKRLALKAVPWATTCVNCQEKAEQKYQQEAP